ncbi:(Fe-S) cluster biosynthesis co-chaperone HscB [Gammaproteobacteria bacterium]
MPMDNPFELFGLTPSFEIDEQRLATTFRSVQRAVHPDRYAGGSDQERRWAVERAAAVNDAYQLLRDPLRRARYLLSLRGVETQEEGNTVMDTSFLMGQMELREQLGEVREAADPVTALAAVKNTLQERRAVLLGELGECLRADTDESLAQAAEKVRRLRFFNRLVEEATMLEERYLDDFPL